MYFPTASRQAGTCGRFFLPFFLISAPQKCIWQLAKAKMWQICTHVILASLPPTDPSMILEAQNPWLDNFFAAQKLGLTIFERL